MAKIFVDRLMARNVILRNTLFSYARTLIAAALAIFSSRWILADLGATDYGIFGLVGGLLIVVEFIQNTIAQGSDRFLAYAIGEGDKLKVRQWFNVVANVFILSPILLLPIAFIVGEIAVRYVIRIPAERVPAALWVWRFALLSFMVSLCACAYRSMLVAHQHIHLFTMVSLCRNVGLFIIALLLPYFGGDHLVVYSGLVGLSLLIMNMTYVCVCRRKCTDARIVFSYWWNMSKMKELFAFSGWVTLGSIGTVVRQTGVSLMLNWMRGPIANAGLGVAHMLSGQMQTLAQSFLTAVAPEVSRRAGARLGSQMIRLTQHSVKLGILLLFMVGLPLFCECDTILALWLKNPPAYAAFLTRVAIVEALLSKMVFGHRMCFNAIGAVRGRNIIEVSTLSFVVIAVGIVYWLTKSVELSFGSCVFVKLIYVWLNVWWGAHCFSWKMCDYFFKLFMPVVTCFVVGVFMYLKVFRGFYEGSLSRVVIVTLIGEIYLIAAFGLFIFDQDERNLLSGKIAEFRRKYKG